MKINITMPFDRLYAGDEFVTGEAVVETAQAAERAGFHAARVTDHPAPTGRWLDNAGHHAQDPFVMLSLIAAATRTLRLDTAVLVLPYRNPFVVARAVSTLDVFSGGRVTLGVGAGYLKGEYRALGVDFDRRNELMDEYIRAMKAAWGADEFTFEGTGYQALGNRILPRPLQRPHPPILIGGNSRRAIRRAVELADGWNPFVAVGLLSKTSRTADLGDERDLAQAVSYMRAHCEAVGRESLPSIVLGGAIEPSEAAEPQALLDRLARYEALGVSACAAHVEGRTRAEWCDNAERFGEAVVSKLA